MRPKVFHEEFEQVLKRGSGCNDTSEAPRLCSFILVLDVSRRAVLTRHTLASACTMSQRTVIKTSPRIYCHRRRLYCIGRSWFCSRAAPRGRVAAFVSAGTHGGARGMCSDVDKASSVCYRINNWQLVALYCKKFIILYAKWNVF